MDDKIIKESKTIRKYIRKDGTIVEKEYTQRYVAIDKNKKVSKTTIIDKIRTANLNQLKRIQDILNENEQAPAEQNNPIE